MGKVSNAVVERVAKAENVDPRELNVSLYEVIDPDALDALFAPTCNGPRPVGKITFEFCGHTVVVTGDRTVSLADERSAAVSPTDD
ncbi:hypothetical protein HUG10_16440 [Halorarum halophilum]|uniref:Halobacterial output domain-containing protein n=1 Tax=Halorarum halophilum TaxID=2743090 RepID=A0A7D5GH08_9EURY|nr:HalOD1 output domain-containing protein [Halobaculum halophilum]QLG29548.1 hypothetical protein HUG10_16440 [Halobaculum halophilum]